MQRSHPASATARRTTPRSSGLSAAAARPGFLRSYSRFAIPAHGPLVRSPVLRRLAGTDLLRAWRHRHAPRPRAYADHRAHPQPASQPVAVRADAGGPRVPARVVRRRARWLLLAADDVSVS